MSRTKNWRSEKYEKLPIPTETMTICMFLDITKKKMKSKKKNLLNELRIIKTLNVMKPCIYIKRNYKILKKVLEKAKRYKKYKY